MVVFTPPPPSNKVVAVVFLGGEGEGYIGITLSVRLSIFLVRTTPPKQMNQY